MRALILSIAATVPLACGAQAQSPFSVPAFVPVTLTCQFDRECLAAESCQATSYDVEVTFGTPVDTSGLMPMIGIMSSVAADIPVILRTTLADEWWEDAEVIFGLDDAATHVLTRAPEGTTVYTVQTGAAPWAITYFGTCDLREI